MAKDNNDSSSISSESIDFLQDVKKGKMRRFAMICKGQSIASLVVFKKGSIEARKKEAKESGKGQFYFGVVTGKGVDIQFVLARADGFDSAPVKTLILKNYLDEMADLKCKPTFEIVDVGPLVLDEDDPLVARFTQLQTNAVSVCNSQPQVAPPISKLVEQIRQLFVQEQTDQVAGQLDQLESLLNNAASHQSQAVAGDRHELPVAGRVAEPNAPEQRTEDSGRAAKLAEALKKIKPWLSNASTARPELAQELQGTFVEIVNLVKQSAYADASKRIIAFTAQLKSILAPPNANEAPVSATSTSDSSNSSLAFEQFTSQCGQLEGLLRQAKRVDLEKAAKLQGVWDFAQTQASSGNYEKALEAVQRLKAAIEKILAVAPKSSSEQMGIEPGLVARRKFMLTRIHDLPRDFEPSLTKLRQAIAAEVPNENVTLLCDAIQNAINSMFSEMQAEFDAAINAGDSTKLRDLKARILGNTLMKELFNNPFVSGSEFQNVVQLALDEVERNMAA